MSSGTSSRRCEGLRFFCDDRLQHRLVQAQVRDDLLELPVLFLKLTQSSKLRRANAAVLLLPDIERRVADAHLATYLVDARPQLVLLQRKCDLVLGELASLHDMLLALSGPSIMPVAL